MILSAVFFLSLNLFAQITDIKISDKVNIDKIYAGIYSNTEFSLDSLQTICHNNTRVGAMITYKPVKWLSLKYWAISQIEPKTLPWGIQQFWFKFNLSPKISLETGNMATLETEQKPHPSTADGQFETSSEATIPGMAINAKIKYQITEKLQIAGGISKREGLPEYSGRIIYKTIKLSGWYSVWNKEFGSALTTDFWRVHTNFVYLQSKSFSNNSTFIINEKEEISFYNDIVYDLSTEKISRCEFGGFKSFKSKFCKGLLGLGYVHEDNSLVAHFLISL